MIIETPRHVSSPVISYWLSATTSNVHGDGLLSAPEFYVYIMFHVK